MSRRVVLGALALAVTVVGCRDAGERAPAPVSAAAPAPPASQAQVASAPAKSPRPDDACADCHPDEVEGFARTGMGRALYTPRSTPPIEDFAPEKATVTHAPSGLVYRAFVDEQGRWWQAESMPGTSYERKVEVRYVIGSGNHTRSYIGEVEGELIQLPLTWYSRRKIWDMSPGYERADTNYRFARPVIPQCLFCHNGLSPARPGTMAGYDMAKFAEGIGCDRCHGDGAEHVKARLAGGGPPAGQADPTILNPKRLPPQKQHRVCEQCHLQGEARVLLDGQRWDAYDVRTPLEDFVSIWSPKQAGGPEFTIASHGQRLSLSACATKSDGRLGCTTCHNPHRPDDGASKRAACLSCHQPKDCGDEHGLAADADCAGCHMRSGGTSDIPHVTFTDHFIRKKPKADETRTAPSTELVDMLAATRVGHGEKASVREAIAHFEVFRFGHSRNGRAHLPLARQLLTEVTEKFPDDARAWRALGGASASMGNAKAAAEAYARATALAPDDPLALTDLADALEAQGRLKEAEEALRKAIALREDYRVAWGNLGNNLQRQGRHDDAEQAYARADALAPFLALTANNRGHNFLSQGRLDEARRWFEEALRRDPSEFVSHFNVAFTLIEGGHPAEALAPLDRALARSPDFPLGLWLRGRARLATGDTAGSRDDLERLIAVEPSNLAGYLELSKAYAEAGDRRAAQAVLARAMVTVGPRPEIATAIQQLNQAPASAPPSK